MSMGYGAGFAEVIKEKTVKKFCPKEFKNFLNAIEVADDDTINTLESVAQFLEHGEEDELSANTIVYFEQLVNAFHKKTGLNLCLSYHDSESEGDRYDEVNGYYWHVSGMFQLTKAGKKMKKYVDRKFFVTFG